MTEFQPDLTFPNRCISVHWSLPTQCDRDASHADNWHWARHPDTGKRIRYRRTLGIYATEELGVGEWHTLQIPPPERRDVPALVAEVDRLRKALTDACDQLSEQEAETARWSAEAEQLRAAQKRVRDLHGGFICGCGDNHGIGCFACRSSEYPCPTIRTLDGGES